LETAISAFIRAGRSLLESKWRFSQKSRGSTARKLEQKVAKEAKRREGKSRLGGPDQPSVPNGSTRRVEMCF